MILRIAFKNLLHKPLYAVLCWLLLACSTAVLLLLITLSRQAKEQLEKQIDGVDMVLGAKGSPLQLILSSVYNIDAPTGNIYLEEAQRFMQHPLVESAIPVSLGDSYMGYRIIGTTEAYLQKYKLQPASGKTFSKAMEVVIGATVAQRSQLKIGSKFAGTHGLGEKGHVHEEHSYVVTGILPATGLSVDQLILTPLQSVWEIHEKPHEEHEEHEEHEAAKQQITAVLIKFKSPLAQLQMPRMVNENTNMQAAVPAIEINRLQSLMGSGTAVLRILGWLLAALATCSIFVMLVQGTHERRYELALLRSMGYGRGKLLGLVLAEAAILGITGILGGFLLSRLCGWFLQQEVFSHYHLNFSGAWKITPADMITGMAILAACLLAALFPAIRAFRLNISKTLANA
ncbi:ABC transporter permease [Chitinophaga niabensis]|uniref:Putative ABC transport system permease protein n=1 Tax=Chitinophaga niabensis TaxID=536979 RepID=A0A1N6JVS2_9BACT|nr:FtsX-like permease family protein [Chitinophaga niabensis]SIO48126.1 putative ABC transport system permease protein [Chitinophaga niabensis]